MLENSGGFYKNSKKYPKIPNGASKLNKQQLNFGKFRKMMGMPKKGKMTGIPKFLIAGKFQKGLEKL